MAKPVKLDENGCRKFGMRDNLAYAAGEGAKEMMGGFSILRLISMAGGMLGLEYTKEDLLEMNAKLNKIKKPNK
ncbi:MAG: hypothetical protein IIV99_04590 [Oscillospiraceae bacterium]|nr:hypothetical protein [Oscillospiraceae bacterium]